MLIDDVTIEVKAGKGGDGAVLFSRTKMTLGPTGGDGGQGGNIYLEGISNIGALRQFRHKKSYLAPDGKQGAQNRKTGKDGEDLILKVPVGTVAHNLISGKDAEIENLGQQILVAKGGQGGRGNFSFRSSRNTSPKESTPGLEGETAKLRLELKLIADVGLIGLPNAGKSSLLNTLTNAQSKVANYPFTTLEPNLGAYYELIIADIPGLIEGASAGKGLGIKFLRHVERTKILFHLISAESTDPFKDYQTIKAELKAYNPKLLEKPEYLFLSKTDLVDEKTLKEQLKNLKKTKAKIFTLSLKDDSTLEQVKKILNSIKDQK